MTADSRVLKVILPILATVAIVAPLAWLWQASRVPGSYSVMDMGYLDYGGGAKADMGGGRAHARPCSQPPLRAGALGHRHDRRPGTTRRRTS